MRLEKTRSSAVQCDMHYTKPRGVGEPLAMDGGEKYPHRRKGLV